MAAIGGIGPFAFIKPLEAMANRFRDAFDVLLDPCDAEREIDDLARQRLQVGSVGAAERTRCG